MYDTTINSVEHVDTLAPLTPANRKTKQMLTITNNGGRESNDDCHQCIWCRVFVLASHTPWRTLCSRLEGLYEMDDGDTYIY